MSAKQQTALPDPQPGDVLRYAYLWADEQEAGREEGTEDRPCLVVVVRDSDEAKRVAIVPITRSPQGRDSIELSANVKAKARLGSRGAFLGGVLGVQSVCLART